MSTVKHKRPYNLSPGGRQRRKLQPSVKKEIVDEGPEYTVLMHGKDSAYWAIRLDEAPSFSDVTVYDAQGQVIKVIAREQLLRPWQEKHNNTWNNCIFPKRISDKV